MQVFKCSYVNVLTEGFVNTNKKKKFCTWTLCIFRPLDASSTAFWNSTAYDCVVIGVNVVDISLFKDLLSWNKI